MQDDTPPRDKVESPCVQVCVIHPAARICTGCYRTLDEIARWGAMDAATRARIVAELPARAPQLARRRGGRTRTHGPR